MSIPRPILYSRTTTEQSRPSQRRPTNARSESSKSGRRDTSPSERQDERKGDLSEFSMCCSELRTVENLTLPSTTYSRHSIVSQRSDDSANGEFSIPMAFDPNPIPGPSPLVTKPTADSQIENVNHHASESISTSRDYFSTKGSKPTVRKVSQERGIPFASPPPDSPRDSRQSSGPSSPHIAYQEIGRDINHESPDYVRKRRDHSISGTISQSKSNDVPKEPSGRPNGESRNGKFQLGEVPKNKRHSPKSSKSSTSSPILDTLSAVAKSKSAPSSSNNHVKEQQAVSPPTESQLSARIDQDSDGSSQTTQESRSHDNGSVDSSTSHSSPVTAQLPNQLRTLPRRGDSLQKSGNANKSARKDENTVVSSISAKLLDEGKPLSAPPTTTSEHPNTTLLSHSSIRGASRPIDSPSSLGNSEIPYPPPRARNRQPPPSVSNADAFSTPRAPPQAPTGYLKSRNESVSTIRSEVSRSEDAPVSPKLPRNVQGGDSLMDDDVTRILSSDSPQEHSSFLRRVSNSVRHARSYSDRGTRISKEHRWPKSPLIGGSFPPEASSSTSSSPDTRDEVAWLRNELRQEQERGAEREQRLQELELAAEAKNNIQQMNTELRTKRSTMVMLDTQKEIVVRELEILTEHIANTKKSSDPLDFSNMSNTVVRQFGESLQALKDSYTPDIEELAQQKLELKDDINGLTQEKDKSFSEFEQLSSKNAQLAELNNQLVHNIQELYKANAGPTLDIVRPPPNGLGIYTHHQKDRSTASIDGQHRGPSLAESNFTGSTMTETESDNATFLNAPQVVNIKKAQPKKFWKKGSQNVAKGVKGLKGAFGSNEAKGPRDMQFTEGMPYGSMPQSQEYPVESLSRPQGHDPSRQGFGFFGNQRKPAPHQQWRNQSTNGAIPANGSMSGQNDGSPGKLILHIQFICILLT